ncbi:MAG: macro domain-containing protein, partial [Metallosphaera sp.]
IRRSLEKGEELGLHSIALPAISTGIYGFPLEVCAEVMASTFLDFKPRSIRKVFVVLYSKEAYEKFLNVFNKRLTL